MKNGKNRVHEYAAFFEPNEHGDCSGSVPSLPGLVTEGRDLARALAMANDAIQRYIEGLNKGRQLKTRTGCQAIHCKGWKDLRA